MNKRALLVNDSRFESLILKDMLNGLGYDVELADEFDAIYEVEQFQPHVVIVNYIMRESKGDQLIKDIKSSQPTSKCLLSSNSRIETQLLDKEIDGVLRTPVSMFTLQDTLKRVGEMAEGNLKSSSKEAKNCSSCHSDLTSFALDVMYCPYCGKSL